MALAEPVLWPLDDHTQAKHRVLRAYLDAWIPIMAQQALKVQTATLGRPRLLLVDGFAGPGRYDGGGEGSPLIMLDALLSHGAFPRFGDVQFLYLFIEHDQRRIEHLNSELKSVDLPANVHVDVVQGEFEEEFGKLVGEVHGSGGQLVPTFAFIDPFGYSAASMSLSGQFLNFPRCEALIFLPLTYIHRFVGREGQEEAMTALFGSDQWRQAINIEGDERRRFLLDLFKEQLRGQGQVEFVESFALRTKDGNDYQLAFATGHRRGLEIMRDAMWAVDPLEGTRYIAQTDTGQEVLFAGSSAVNTAPLLDQLRAHFGTEWFTVEAAEEVTLLETPYRPSGHLKRLTLKPAEANNLLEVDREPGAGKGTFARVRRMRFRPESD